MVCCVGREQFFTNLMHEVKGLDISLTRRKAKNWRHKNLNCVRFNSNWAIAILENKHRHCSLSRRQRVAFMVGLLLVALQWLKMYWALVMGVMSRVLENFSRTAGAPCQPSASKSREALGEVSLTEPGTFPSPRPANLASTWTCHGGLQVYFWTTAKSVTKCARLHF